MAALAVQVKSAVVAAVEVHTPLHQAPDAFGGVFHYLAHGSLVADVVAGNERVFHVFLEVVYFKVGHRGYAALRLGRVGFVEGGFADEGHAAFARCGHL